MAIPLDVIANINRKKAQYGRFIDTKQWDKLNEVILPECQLKFLDTDGSPLKVGKARLDFGSREAFLSFKNWFARADTLHDFGPGELDWCAAGKDETLAIWAMEDQIIFEGQLEIRGGGYYHETWILRSGEWFLKSLRLERTYNKITPLGQGKRNGKL